MPGFKEIQSQSCTSICETNFCHVYRYRILYNGHNSDHVTDMQTHQFVKRLIGTFHAGVLWYRKVAYENISLCGEEVKSS